MLPWMVLAFVWTHARTGIKEEEFSSSQMLQLSSHLTSPKDLDWESLYGLVPESPYGTFIPVLNKSLQPLYISPGTLRRHDPTKIEQGVTDQPAFG